MGDEEVLLSTREADRVLVIGEVVERRLRQAGQPIGPHRVLGTATTVRSPSPTSRPSSFHEFFHNYLRPHTALDCRAPNE